MTASLTCGKTFVDSKVGIRIAPSQQRNIKICLNTESKVPNGMPLSFQLQFLVLSQTEKRIAYWHKTTEVISISNKNFGDVYKLTFKDFDATVQYGIYIYILWFMYLNKLYTRYREDNYYNVSIS